jgi:hypothetical protein
MQDKSYLDISDVYLDGGQLNIGFPELICMQVQGQYLETDHNKFLPQPLQFAIYDQPII